MKCIICKREIQAGQPKIEHKPDGKAAHVLCVEASRSWLTSREATACRDVADAAELILRRPVRIEEVHGWLLGVGYQGQSVDMLVQAFVDDTLERHAPVVQVIERMGELMSLDADRWTRRIV